MSRFTLVGVQKTDLELFAIKDALDGDSMEVVTKDELLAGLKVNIGVDGITYSNGEISYDSSLLVQPEPENIMDSEYIDDVEVDDTEYYDDDEDAEYSEDESEEEYSDEDEDSDTYDYDDEGTYEEEETYVDDDEDSDTYDYDDEGVDYYEEAPSVMSELYALLKPEQIKVLQNYYLWVTQNIFLKGNKSSRLTITKNTSARQASIISKKKAFAENAKKVGTWNYAGFIDMGSVCETCTFGHPLRYVHLAWNVANTDIGYTNEETGVNITTDLGFWGESYNPNFEEILDDDNPNVIKFGLDCVLDFFDIDENCKHSLQYAQSVSKKDMELLLDIYKENKVEEYKASFDLTKEAVAAVTKIVVTSQLMKKQPPVDSALVLFFKQFNDADMLYPKSLVQLFRNQLTRWNAASATDFMKAHKIVGEPHRISTDDFYFGMNLITNIKNTEDVFNTAFKTAGRGSFRFDVSSSNNFWGALLNYFYMYFYREVCGAYAYDPYSKLYKDEGGTSKPMKSWFNGSYMIIKDKMFDNYTFHIDYMKNLVKFLELYCTAVNTFKTKAKYFEFYVKTTDDDIIWRHPDNDKYAHWEYKVYDYTLDVDSTIEELDASGKLDIYGYTGRSILENFFTSGKLNTKFLTKALNTNADPSDVCLRGIELISADTMPSFKFSYNLKPIVDWVNRKSIMKSCLEDKTLEGAFNYLTGLIDYLNNGTFEKEYEEYKNSVANFCKILNAKEVEIFEHIKELKKESEAPVVEEESVATEPETVVENEEEPTTSSTTLTAVANPTADDVFKYIKEAWKDKEVQTKVKLKQRLWASICDTISGYTGSRKPSSNQMYYLSQVYTFLTGEDAKSAIKAKEYTELTDSDKDVADKIIADIDGSSSVIVKELGSDDAEKMHAIVNSIVARNKYSDKQYAWLERGKNILGL